MTTHHVGAGVPPEPETTPDTTLIPTDPLTIKYGWTDDGRLILPPPGRELDTLVAEKVMGLVPGKEFGPHPEHTWIRSDYDGEIDTCAWENGNHNGPQCDYCGYHYCHHCYDLDVYKPGDYYPCDKAPPLYSIDIAVAFKVAEQEGIYIWPTDNNRWYCQCGRFDTEYGGEMFFAGREVMEYFGKYMSDTAPEAICRAALANYYPKY